jgi:serine O-acetyltransferase
LFRCIFHHPRFTKGLYLSRDECMQVAFPGSGYAQAWSSAASASTRLLGRLITMTERDIEADEAGVSADVADWSRERPRQFWDPGRKLLLSIRRHQFWRRRVGIVSACVRRWLVLRYRFWSVVTGADIPLNCNIGGGLLVVHPNGIVIHPDAKIGVNCLIFQQVTIGCGKDGVPDIAGHVDIGAGAKILGAVRIGAHAKIGANAVVLKDVPSRGIAVGIPAQILL